MVQVHIYPSVPDMINSPSEFSSSALSTQNLEVKPSPYNPMVFFSLHHLEIFF